MLCSLLFLLLISNINIVQSLPLFWVGGVTSNSAKLCLQVNLLLFFSIYYYYYLSVY